MSDYQYFHHDNRTSASLYIYVKDNKEATLYFKITTSVIESVVLANTHNNYGSTGWLESSHSLKTFQIMLQVFPNSFVEITHLVTGNNNE